MERNLRKERVGIVVSDFKPTQWLNHSVPPIIWLSRLFRRVSSTCPWKEDEFLG